MYPQEKPSCGSLFKLLLKQADANLADIISKFKSDKWSKKLSTRDQLELLVSANLAQTKSLSDIPHMVSGTSRFNCLSIHKSSLSRINDHRDYQVFEQLYLKLLSQARKQVGYSKLRVIDTTTEVVSKLLFPLWPWGKTRAGVRITAMFDPNFELPDQITFGSGNQGDLTLVKDLKLKRGITYLFDAGFHQYKLYQRIIDKKAFFITRQHKTCFSTIVQNVALSEDDVISDQIVLLGTNTGKKAKMSSQTRLIKFYTKEGNVMLLSTNRFDLTTKQVRDLYRKRWEIEVFFKFIKQNLKVKKFFGRNINAVKTQIYCALIAYLLVYLIKPKQTRMTEFMRKVHYALFLDYTELTFFDTS